MDKESLKQMIIENNSIEADEKQTILSNIDQLNDEDMINITRMIENYSSEAAEIQAEFESEVIAAINNLKDKLIDKTENKSEAEQFFANLKNDISTGQKK